MTASSTKLQIYISAVVLTAVPIFSFALRDVIAGNYGYGWLMLAAITLITVPIFVFLPSVSTTVGIGDAFVISISMLYGTSPAILVNTLYMTFLTLLLRRKHKTTVQRIIFNLATGVLNVWLYSSVFFSLKRSQSYSFEDVILPTFALAFSFFLSNSFLVAGAIALSSGRNVFSFWYENYRSLILDFLVSACAGAFIWLLGGYAVWAPILAAPCVGAVWGLNKINRAKAIEAEQHLREQEHLYLRTVESLALAVDAKDQTTYGHIRRVRAYAMGLAKICGISDTKELMAIETGSLLHDIGKLAIDDYILNKPGRLSKQEFEKMKMHAAAGDEILQQIQFPFPVAKFVRCHHERWDGTGYPDGLKGEEIPLGARILAIADAFDAIRSARPYKLSFGIRDSIDLLRAQAGTMYDPNLVQLFIQHIDQLEEEAVEAAKNIPQLSFRNYFEKVDLALASGESSISYSSLPSPASAELVSLHEFCKSLGKQLDLPDILSILARRIKRLLPYATCAFYLDYGDDTLKAAHISGKFSEVLQKLSIGLGKGISGWVAAYRRPIFNTGPALEFQEIEGDFSCLTDTLVVPMVVNGGCIGTISLYAENPVFYSQAHLELLQIVAGQAGPLLADVMEARSSPDRVLVDPVTQAYRVGYLSVIGAQMLTAAEKNQSPVSLLCLDLKNFSQLVNLYGAQIGDSILKKVGDILRAELRETDVLVRFGQQAFVALLAGVREEQAVRYAQRLQQQVRNTPVGNVGGHNVYTICQTGLASYPRDGSTIFALLDSAQSRLSPPPQATDITADGAEGNVVEFLPRN